MDDFLEGDVDIEVLEGSFEDRLPEGDRYNGNDSDHIREGDNNDGEIVDNEVENVEDIYDENCDNGDEYVLLMLSMFGKIFSRAHTEIYLEFFSENIYIYACNKILAFSYVKSFFDI